MKSFEYAHYVGHPDIVQWFLFDVITISANFYAPIEMYECKKKKKESRLCLHIEFNFPAYLQLQCIVGTIRQQLDNCKSIKAYLRLKIISKQYISGLDISMDYSSLAAFMKIQEAFSNS